MSCKKYIASMSGGKDSTAMVLRLIEENMPLDEIVFFDTGWEFPEMYEHLDKFERYSGRKITRLHPADSFDYTMCERPIVRNKKSSPMHRKIYRLGNGWPSFFCRWCTREKVTALNAYCDDSFQYVGIAYDEQKRMKERIYPLNKWEMTELDCLIYCRGRGFNWRGLYDHFSRVSCFCCPLKGLKDFRTLRNNYPELWIRMLKMGSNVTIPIGQRFWHGLTIEELDKRFATEDRQGRFEI